MSNLFLMKNHKGNLHRKNTAGKAPAQPIEYIVTSVQPATKEEIERFTPKPGEIFRFTTIGQ